MSKLLPLKLPRDKTQCATAHSGATDRVTYSQTTFVRLEDGTKCPRRIPRPFVPVRPPLSLQALLDLFRLAAPSVLDARHTVQVGYGRQALRLVLESIEPTPGARVLVPAYHCDSMIEPIRELGLRPVFYRITADLKPDVSDLADLARTPACALIVVHFFGLPAPLGPLRSLAQQAGAAIVEDCAHAFFGTVDGAPLGTLGDYAIASSRKFFPTEVGGLAACHRGALPDAPAGRPRPGSLRALLQALSFAVDHGRLPLLRPLERLKRLGRPAPPMPPPEVWSRFRQGATDPVPLSRFEKLLVSRTASWRHVLRRRSNFMRLAEAFSRMDRCRPLIKSLPDGAVPYLFPLHIHDLDALFGDLEDRAVPMQRFGQFPDAAAARCAVSADYARNVVQLPCHQELRDKELDWLIGQVTEAVRAASPARSNAEPAVGKP